MKNLLIGLFCLVFFFVSQVSANDEESWYLYLDLGYAKILYSDQLKTATDILKDSPNVSHLSMGMTLGFYWPVNNHMTALGFNFNSAGDFYKNNTSGVDSDMSITVTTTAFSTMHYFNKIGDGFYLRGDLGFSRFSTKIIIGNASLSSDSKIGMGALAGIGYAFPVSSGTRLTFLTTFAHRSAKDDDTKLKANIISILFGAIF